MTTVTAKMARSYTPGMFADLELPTHTRVLDKPSGVTTLTFDGDLTEEQAAQVWARMESVDDTDQAKRADLREKRDALTPSDPISDALIAAVNYQLGDV